MGNYWLDLNNSANSKKIDCASDHELPIRKQFTLGQGEDKFHVSILGNGLARPIEIEAVDVTPISYTRSSFTVNTIDGKMHVVAGRLEFDPITITFDYVESLKGWQPIIPGPAQSYTIAMVSCDEVLTLTGAFVSDFQVFADSFSPIQKYEISFLFGEAKHAIIKDQRRILDLVIEPARNSDQLRLMEDAMVVYRLTENLTHEEK